MMDLSSWQGMHANLSGSMVWVKLCFQECKDFMGHILKSAIKNRH